MKRNLVFVVLILQGFVQNEAVSETGTVGKSVKITCSHSYASTNDKYFCKGACNDADVLIKSNVRDQNGKYSIKDEGNTFIVTISNLKMADAGTYWCGIERVGVDTYNEVSLVIVEGNQNAGLTNLQTNKLVYVGTGLGVTVLALAAILLLFFRLRKRDVNMSSGKEDDEVKYVKPSIWKKTQHAEATLVNEEQGGDCMMKTDQPGALYTTIPSESKIQSDELFYSTISFSEQPTCRSASPQTEQTMYSSVKPKSKVSTS